MVLYYIAIKIIVLGTFLFALSAQATIQMWHYLTKRQSILSALLFVLYLVLLLLFISMPLINYQHMIIYGAIGLFLIAFPHLFIASIIQNPYKYTESATSFQLQGAHGDYLPINAPELGIFLVGTPGCGKTKYVIEPLIASMINKGYSGLIYDYDFSNEIGKSYSLSQLAYNCSLRSVSQTKFLNINF